MRYELTITAVGRPTHVLTQGGDNEIHLGTSIQSIPDGRLNLLQGDLNDESVETHVTFWGGVGEYVL